MSRPDDVVTRYAAGASLRALAREYHVSHQTIKRWVGATHLRPPGRPIGDPRRVARVWQLHRAGHTPRDIASLLELSSVRAVHRILRRGQDDE